MLNGETRKTKIIRRGGQHPEWDEEIRFTIYEDSDALNVSDDGSPPPLPPKAGRGPKRIQGGEKMPLACFAADKEPELIGETMVDLNEVLTKGETDGMFSKNFSSLPARSDFLSEWFTLTNKDKYCGEVYLELTFWSNVRCFPLEFIDPALIASLARNHAPRRKQRQSLQRLINNTVVRAFLFHQRNPLVTINKAVAAPMTVTVGIRFLPHCSHPIHPWVLICTSLSTNKQCERARRKAPLWMN